MTKDQRISITVVSLAAVAVLAAIIYPVFAQNGVSGKTRDFIEKAAQGGLYEVRSSEVALQRAQRGDVRSFAQKMIEDHTEANQDLKTAISQAGIAFEPPTVLDDAHQGKVKELGEADVEDIDEDYIEDQIEAHEKTIELFEEYAEDGDNTHLQQFASRTLPILRGHEEMIKNIDEVEVE